MREAMVMSASGDERRERILHEVMAHGKVTVTGLSELLGVTTETIRKDLVTLEERNVISKRHGFVTLATPMPERDFEKGESLHLAEKTAIAERAAPPHKMRPCSSTRAPPCSVSRRSLPCAPTSPSSRIRSTSAKHSRARAARSS